MKDLLNGMNRAIMDSRKRGRRWNEEFRAWDFCGTKGAEPGIRPDDEMRETIAGETARLQLSFLCKDREEKFHIKSYNDKNKPRYRKRNVCG